MEIIPFQHEHLPSATDILVQLFSEFLKVFPLLPKRVTAPGVAKAFLTAQFEKRDCHGVVMMEHDRVIGYLFGAYDENAFFGRHAWVPLGGVALENQNDAEKMRLLYALAGERWVQDGILNHYLVVPALPAWLEIGFSLSFGQEQAYALASVDDEKAEIEPPDGIVIREVLPSDAGQLYDRGDWIAAHYNRAPVWEPVPAEHLAGLLPAYAELAEDRESTTWVALDGDQIVSFVVINAEDVGPTHLLGAPETAHFTIAATHPDYRGRGIGRALFTHTLNVAHQQGYEVITTDWRTTNSAAARYWPSFGFVPFAYRLLRRVNPRYVVYRPHFME